jgi:hypothetical protein
MPSATAQLYIEGYLQAMLEVMYKQEYLRVRVVDDQVISLYYMFAFAMDCILSSSCTFVV